MTDLGNLDEDLNMDAALFGLVERSSLVNVWLEYSVIFKVDEAGTLVVDERRLSRVIGRRKP